MAPGLLYQSLVPMKIMMKQKFFHSVFFALALLSAACGSGGTTSDESGELVESLVLGSISEIEFGTDGAVIQFDSVSASQTYLIDIFSYNDSSATYAFEITTEGSSNISQAVMALTSGSIDVTEDFHEQLRNAEETLDGEVVEASNLHASVQALTIGSTSSFKVITSTSSSSSYTTVTGKLRYENDDFYLYIDTRVSDSISDSEMNSFVTNFAASVASERTLFGGESDVNGDGHFIVLITPAVNQLGASGGGIITGFFYAIDLYSSDTYAASNEMEIYYTLAPDPSGTYGTAVSESFAYSNYLVSVLPHEFQHMISYNQHVFLNGGSSESSFLNEGMSHLAEDIYSINSDNYMAEVGVENPSRIANYLDATDSTCFICGSSLVQRGGSYLFMRYLYEQAQKGNMSGASDGADFINRLLNTSRTGLSNIVFAALESTDNADFKDLLGPFGLAMYLSDTDLTTDNRYTFEGIDLRAVQDDNRSTSLEGTAFQSISSLAFSDTVVTAGHSYMTLTGDQIIATGNRLQINVADGMLAGGFVVQLDAD